MSDDQTEKRAREDAAAILRALPLAEWMGWSWGQFPDQTAASVLDHLAEEVSEVRAALAGDGNPSEEVADVLALATRLALMVAGEQLPGAMTGKLALNRARDWNVRRPEAMARRDAAERTIEQTDRQVAADDVANAEAKAAEAFHLLAAVQPAADLHSELDSIDVRGLTGSALVDAVALALDEAGLSGLAATLRSGGFA